MRPGGRVSFSNLFKTQLIGSISAKQILSENWELRAILGSANRTPSYNELYTFFVDVNHDVQGNPELDPEQGLSVFLHLKKKSALYDGRFKLKNKFIICYLNTLEFFYLTILKLNNR